MVFSDTMEDSLVAWEREEVRAHPGFGFYPHTVWNTLETMVQVLYSTYHLSSTIQRYLYYPSSTKQIHFTVAQYSFLFCSSTNRLRSQMGNQFLSLPLLSIFLYSWKIPNSFLLHVLLCITTYCTITTDAFLYHAPFSLTSPFHCGSLVLQIVFDLSINNQTDHKWETSSFVWLFSRKMSAPSFQLFFQVFTTLDFKPVPSFYLFFQAFKYPRKEIPNQLLSLHVLSIYHYSRF